MMNFIDEFTTLALVARIRVLGDESMKIGNAIGDVPVIFFPEQHKRLIELSEEMYDIEQRLYQIFIENGETERAELMLVSERETEKALYLLKR